MNIYRAPTLVCYSTSHTLDFGGAGTIPVQNLAGGAKSDALRSQTGNMQAAGQVGIGNWSRWKSRGCVRGCLSSAPLVTFQRECE